MKRWAGPMELLTAQAEAKKLRALGWTVRIREAKHRHSLVHPLYYIYAAPPEQPEK